MNKLFLAASTLLVLLSLTLLAERAQAAQLVMFEEQGCPWCAAFRREVLSIYGNTEEAKIAPIRRVDILKSRPKDLSHIKGIRVSPTFVLLDDDGREVGRILGYPGFDTFWELLDGLLQKLEKRRKDATEARNNRVNKMPATPRG